MVPGRVDGADDPADVVDDRHLLVSSPPKITQP
jgi:hypothetical protein